YSCTILTRPAISLLAEIHPRMPLILDKNNAQNWLQQPLRTQLDHLQSYNDYPLILK
ncbi:MAG: SOS response-associated peptidase, partial [Gammaproteobacteria bacterium]|nr:SOS response-associated peptidase [Gammaproteobacteria bacterium]